MTATELTLLVLAVSVAGGVKGLFGVGFPTMAITLCALFLDPKLAIVLMSIPILVLNAVQVIYGGGPLATLRRYWPILALAMPIGGVVGYLADLVTREALMVVLGVLVVSFSLLNLARWVPKIPDRLDRPAQVATGAVSGVVAGLTLLWAPPLMVYLLGRDATRKEWVGVIGLLLGIGTIPVVVGYMANGSLTGETLWLSVLIAVPALVCQLAGELVGRRIEPTRFRRYLLLMLLVLGLALSARAFFA